MEGSLDEVCGLREKVASGWCKLRVKRQCSRKVFAIKVGWKQEREDSDQTKQRSDGD